MLQWLQSVITLQEEFDTYNIMHYLSIGPLPVQVEKR